jgi:hypothetical protein
MLPRISRISRHIFSRFSPTLFIQTPQIWSKVFPVVRSTAPASSTINTGFVSHFFSGAWTYLLWLTVTIIWASVWSTRARAIQAVSCQLKAHRLTSSRAHTHCTHVFFDVYYITREEVRSMFMRMTLLVPLLVPKNGSGRLLCPLRHIQ